MTEKELLRKAASLRGKKSWEARVKKWGGKNAAAAKMKRVRKGKKLSTESA